MLEIRSETLRLWQPVFGAVALAKLLLKLGRVSVLVLLSKRASVSWRVHMLKLETRTKMPKIA